MKFRYFFTYPQTVVYFSPDDQLTRRLIKLLNSAHQRIYAAVYMISDKSIAQALVDAKKRGVDVQIILDKSSMTLSYGKGSVLRDNYIKLYVFGARSMETMKKSSFEALMHNKFALVDDFVWTGSFNWTKFANHRNQENVIVTDEPGVTKRFERQFKKLRAECYNCSRRRRRVKTPPMFDFIVGLFKSRWAQIRSILGF